MKLDSTFKIPLKVRIASQESSVKVEGLNITLKAGMNHRQISKAFFWLSLHAVWLAVKHLFKKQD